MHVLLRVQYSCGGVLVIWFWWEIDFVLRTYLLCQFLVLAGNRFWLYILLCTWSTIQLFSVVVGKFYYDRKKKGFVVCLAGCAVVSVFGSGGK